MTKEPIIRPVISDLAEKWLRGEISSKDYFAQCRTEAETEARAHVAARLRPKSTR